EDAMDPRLEAIRIPEAPDRDPGLDERLLDRVLGQLVLAEDQPRDAVPALQRARDEGRERFAVPVLGVGDEVSLHRALLAGRAAHLATVSEYESGPQGIVPSSGACQGG